MGVLEDQHSPGLDFVAGLKEKILFPYFFLVNVNIAFKIYIFNGLGIICLMSLQ